MEAAKAAVAKFTSKHGHKTDVDEYVAPAVTQETVKPHRHEETTQALDREVHQDHYHTTVQPIAHQEVLPEKHSHQALPTQHREINHENHEHTQRNVAAELGQFQNTSRTHETTRSQAAAPTVSGEHVHHHVHETVVPVVHKETVQPEVVHTVQPIHETHHTSSQHHGVSALPMKSLDEFKHAGGILGGSKQHSHEQYDGQPRPYNDKLSTTMDKLGFGHHNNSTNAGPHSSNMANSADPRVDSDRDGRGLGQSQGHHGAGTAAGAGALGTTGGLAGAQHGHRNTDSGVGGMGSRRRGSNSSASSSDYEYAANGQKVKKPGLMQKLNPNVDANGDGKAGFMK